MQAVPPGILWEALLLSWNCATIASVSKRGLGWTWGYFLDEHWSGALTGSQSPCILGTALALAYMPSGESPGFYFKSYQIFNLIFFIIIHFLDPQGLTLCLLSYKRPADIFSGVSFK